MSEREKIISYILRVGLAFAFLYPALLGFLDPYAWVGYIPAFMEERGGLDPLVALKVFGAFEAAIALWILSGWKVLYPSAAAALILLLIVAFNLRQIDVLFRDISLAAMALALAVLSWKKA